MTGTPIEVALIGQYSPSDSNPEFQQTIKAVTQQVNGNGGIAGHPLKVDFCPDNDDPNQAGTCARDATSNSKVIASVGTFSNYGNIIDPVFDQAGLASVGVYPLVTADFQSPITFPVASGATGVLAGEGTLLASVLHAKKIGVIAVNVPAALQSSALVQPLVAQYGAKLANAVPIPLTAQDITAQVKQASNGQDALMVVATSPIDAEVVSTAKQLGLSIPIVITDGIEPSDLKSLGSAADGLNISASYPRTGTSYQEYSQQMTAAVGSGFESGQASINTWVAFQLFLQVAKSLPTVTRSSVLTAIRGLDDFSVPGMTPTINFTAPDFKGLGGQLPRMFNSSVYYLVDKGGSLSELVQGPQYAFGTP